MASTYENDLRLEEMATGENSGSWGTKTNTNLELIADAFGYGTEAITTNADTHTTTIADGTSDAGRAIYLKYTGTLDSACTITIGPNTVSKMWFIENATSGSQNIIISQGSGANITIGAGKTKIVYSDGAGAGAAFVEATDDISINSLFLDSLSLEGNATFGDNDKIIMGAGSDLQLYHDGTHSYISDVGEGPLRITSDGTGILLNKSVTESMGRFLTDGAVELFYDNTKTFETTSTGIDVTGTITTDELTVDTSNQVIINHSANGGGIRIDSTNGTNIGSLRFGDVADNYIGALEYNHTDDAMTMYVNNATRMTINSSGNVGIGTSSPAPDYGSDTALEISGASSPGIVINDTGQASKYGIHADSNDLKITYGTGALVTFQNDGNVGIGTSAPSPVGLGIVTGGGAKGVMLTRNGSSGNPTSGQGFGNFGFKGIMDGANSMAAAEASIEAIAAENHSGSTAATDLAFYTKPSGTGPGSGPTERVRITAAGNVGVGTSSPSNYNSTTYKNISVNGSVGATMELFIGGSLRAYFHAYGSVVALGSKVNHPVSFVQNDTIRATIDTSGNFHVAKTSASNAVGCTLNATGQGYFVVNNNVPLLVNRLGSDGTIVQFYNDSSGVGSISISGSSTAYNTSSDYRLKENVVALTGASARVNQLDVKRFNFIADDTNTLVDGFLAHEVADVVPEAITGAKDAMKDEEYEVSPAKGEIYTPLEAAYVDGEGNEVAPTDEVIHSTDVVEPETLAEGQLWRQTAEAVMGTRSVIDPQGIDQSKIVPLLTAALQEALTEITALKARVTTLEG